MTTSIAALTTLITQERLSIIRLARRIVGTREAAEDVAQLLFEKIQKIEEVSAIRNPKAYLFRLASNLAIDHARQARRREEFHEEIHDILWLEDAAPAADRQLGDREELERVEQMIADLPEPTRTFFCLNRFDGLSQTDIARRYGRSPAIVNRHIHRALQILSGARSGL
ncbi:sigma-70 family RNA polymerase sigma factor [Acetobacter musti]|uniref:Sigma-70 family RNA polymerase sigma factor n=1 Tax=Acetobacter musti TaxID=864732 RepID=A0ABX0JX77_9PROT|nr:RNA polymerase sigma factor [Acetobacter musti]NHN86628.1 sigma-70 family RNA polymerase sigma factor [Acetobacter musti]